MSRSAIGVAVLFEGDYAKGAAALVNSLVAGGFRGTIFCGYRGEAPEWLTTPTAVADLDLLAIPVTWEGNLTDFKPTFLLELWAGPAADFTGLVYMDVDIALIGEWAFVERWVAGGIAICADVNADCPEGHPIREWWRELLDPGHERPHRPLNRYYNAGFAGFSRENRSFLERWREFNRAGIEHRDRVNLVPASSRCHPFHVLDQDAFNAALMLGDEPLSPMGRDAMGFQEGGGAYLLAHSIGGRKPWRGSRLLGALARRRPSLAEREFVRHLRGPVRPVPAVEHWLRRLDLALARYVGAAIGR